MMQRFLFSHVLEQTLHQHHTSRPVLVPLLSLSRFVSSAWKITASDSTSSLPVTLDSFNPKKLQQDLKSNKDAYTFNETSAVALNNLEGLTYNQAKGATMMYLFPQMNLPRKVTEAAETTKPSTDAFYYKRTLNTSGSHFGQVPITWHFRNTILSQENKIPSIANRVREFHKSTTTNDIPKRTKFQKQHRGRISKGISSFPRGNRLGKYGLQTLEPAWITSRQIEAGRKAMVRNVRRGEKVLVHIFADKPITKRPTETRMGRGKGATAFWVAVVKPGKIIYEMGGVPENIARKAITIAASKLPIRTRFIISE